MPDRKWVSAAPLTILALIALGAGCSETTAPTPLAPDGAVFAKPDHAGGGGGGSSSPSTVSVRIDWDDDLVVEVDGQPVGAGIIGDGLEVDGVTPGESGYQDGVCGVNARIYTDSNSSGELVFDTYTADGCGDTRVHYFFSGLTATEPLEVATKTIARELWSMEPGQETDHWEGFHFGLPQCDRVVYGAEYGTDDLKRTRLDDGTGARQWRVESRGSHRARCVYWAKGKDRFGAFTDPMPFAFTVTEIVP